MVRESFSTGKTTPSEVAASTIATNSGDFTNPPARRAIPVRIAMAKDTAKPSAVRVTIGPRRRSTSISRPERNSRKASPTRARIETGASGLAQPSPEGPITMPSRISSTIAGSRTRGKKPSAKGASKPTATTMSRLVNMDSRFHVLGATRLVCAAGFGGRLRPQLSADAAGGASPSRAARPVRWAPRRRRYRSRRRRRTAGVRRSGVGRAEVGEVGQQVGVRLEALRGDLAVGHPGEAVAVDVIDELAAVGVDHGLGTVVAQDVGQEHQGG